MREAGEILYAALGWGVFAFEELDYIFHGRWGGGKLLVFAVVVEGGVVEREKGVLDLDLGVEYMWEE